MFVPPKLLETDIPVAAFDLDNLPVIVAINYKTKKGCDISHP